ncbi:MAG TPA: aspartyl protease family protein [Fluviicola sp.]|nr:aspartyl protease family protein [Fluviicola sp.]
MKKLGFILLSAIAVSGCGALKVAKLLKQGDVEQPSFTAEIPFEMRMGLVVVKVNINGKDYDFLVDTGAPNLVTKELAAELKLKSKAEQKAGDSQGKKDVLQFTEMPEMLIGGVHFIEMGAAIADLKRSNEIACLDVDGFVGANLMKEAVWQFDYDRKVITVADSISAFEIPASAFRIPFTPALSSTPLIDITYDGVADNKVTFDTGSNGHFNSSHGIYKSLKEKGKVTNSVVGYGATSSGLYGVGDGDSLYNLMITETKLGNLTIPEQVVAFDPGARTLGTKFLQHYRVIIDWSIKEIILIPTDDFVNNTYETFGIRPFYNEDRLEVRMVTLGSEADKAGIKLGDRILEINGRDVRVFTKEMWCDVINNGLVPENDTVINLIISHDGQERAVRLNKKDMMKKE